jgi:hypothetical protein
MWIGTKRLFRKSAPSSPLTLALSPNPEKGWGRGETLAGTPTQGGRSGDGGPKLLPQAAPWARLGRPDGALGGRSGLLPLHKCPIPMVNAEH